MDSEQKKLYKKVKYFLFLVINSNYFQKTKFISSDEIKHNNTKLKLPDVIKQFLFDCENNQKNKSEKIIKNTLLENYRLCDYFDWLDTFIHPFINKSELAKMSNKSKNYIMTTIFFEIDYHTVNGQNFYTKNYAKKI